MSQKWRIINKQKNANLFPYSIHVEAMGRGFKETFGKSYDNLVEFKNDGNLIQTTIWSQYHNLGKEILNRLLSDKQYAAKVYGRTNYYMDKWFLLTERIINTNLEKSSKSDLINFVINFKKLFYKTSSWGVLISIVEYEHELLSTKIKRLLVKKIKNFKIDISVEDLFQLITTSFSKTYVVKERDDLLKIALLINQKHAWKNLFKKNFNQLIVDIGKFKELDRRIEKHLQKYIWLSFGFEGPVMNKGDVIRSLQELILKKPLSFKKELLRNEKDLKARQKKYLTLLKLNKPEEHIITVARDFGFSKAYRKDIEYHSNYAYHKLLKEIGRRYYFTAHQGHYFFPEELVAIIQNKRKVDLSVINERIKHCIYIIRKGKTKLLTGQEAQSMHRKFFEYQPKEIIDEIQGQCAMSGYARGAVKIILDQKDFNKFAAHNILVSYATNPSMVPLMKIARAIVTDQGGITCHAAIISRELGTPCVIGTKHATKLFKDGDMIEVDATKGIIRKLK